MRVGCWMSRYRFLLGLDVSFMNVWVFQASLPLSVHASSSSPVPWHNFIWNWRAPVAGMSIDYWCATDKCNHCAPAILNPDYSHAMGNLAREVSAAMGVFCPWLGSCDRDSKCKTTCWKCAWCSFYLQHHHYVTKKTRAENESSIPIDLLDAYYTPLAIFPYRTDLWLPHVPRAKNYMQNRRRYEDLNEITAIKVQITANTVMMYHLNLQQTRIKFTAKT